MKSTSLFLLVGIAAAALAAAPHNAAAWSRPELVFSAGKSFAVNGSPSGGGLCASLSPMWASGEHGSFGATVFAHDIGTRVTDLLDPNDHTSLGLTATQHRWAWGAAWRGDYELTRSKRWATGVSGTLGWWRVEDDRSGRFIAAAGAVGLGLGADVRRVMTKQHEVGLALRYHELTSDRHSAFRRVDHYATGALEWRWAGHPRP
jgi:hypothetical protein